MNITFSTADFGDEAASLAAASQARPLDDAHHLYGTVTIEHPGAPLVRIDDDLPFLMQSLCADAPAELRRGGSAEVRPVDGSEPLTLHREGDVVTLTVEGTEPARYPADALLAGLQSCGERFAAFLDRVVDTSPQFARRAEWLRAALAADQVSPAAD